MVHTHAQKLKNTLRYYKQSDDLVNPHGNVHVHPAHQDTQRWNTFQVQAFTDAEMLAERSPFFGFQKHTHTLRWMLARAESVDEVPL